jgi:hypothetical protein
LVVVEPLLEEPAPDPEVLPVALLPVLLLGEVELLLEDDGDVSDEELDAEPGVVEDGVDCEPDVLSGVDDCVPYGDL